MRKLLFDVFVVLCIVSVFVGVILNIFIVDYDTAAAFLLSCYFGLPLGIFVYGLVIAQLYPEYAETKLIFKVIGLLILSGIIPFVAYGGFMGWLVLFNGCASRGVIERKVEIVKEVGGPDDDRKHFVNFSDGRTSYRFVV